MTRRVLLGIGLGLVLIFAGPSIVSFVVETARSTRLWMESAPERRFHAKIERQRNQLPSLLAQRADDHKRYPRSEFSIVMESGDGFRFESGAGVLVWDERYSPDTTIHLGFPPDSLDTLYELAIADRLIELAERRTARDALGSSDEFDPRITVSAGGHGGTIRLRDLAPTYPANVWSPLDFEEPEKYFESDDYKRAKRFQERLDRMIVKIPGYRAIPLPRRKRGIPF
jgi:hypothetical protein